MADDRSGSRLTGICCSMICIMMVQLESTIHFPTVLPVLTQSESEHQICTVDDSDIISTQMYGEWEKYRLAYIEMAWCDKPMDQFMN